MREDVPLENPFWEYSRLKADCETLLMAQSAMPYTILRPSHTFRDRLVTALSEHDLAAVRILAGKPVIVPGDGNSLWTITPSADFAPPFVRLLGQRPRAGRNLPPDRAARRSSGTRSTPPSAGRWRATWRWCMCPPTPWCAIGPTGKGRCKGDKANSVLFDNAKIRSIVGDFAAETDLDRMLERPVAAFRARQAAGGDGRSSTRCSTASPRTRCGGTLAREIPAS